MDPHATRRASDLREGVITIANEIARDRVSGKRLCMANSNKSRCGLPGLASSE